MDLIRERGATLKAALALTAAVLVVELAGGLVSGSLALLSDAGHVLTDVFALGLAWFALEQAKRPGDKRRTYGYQRAGILAALPDGETSSPLAILRFSMRRARISCAGTARNDSAITRGTTVKKSPSVLIMLPAEKRL